MQLIKGQKLPLSQLGLDSVAFDVIVRHHSSANADVAMFGLDEWGKLSDERYMTFYNQPVSPCQAVSASGSTFKVCPSRLPAHIHTLTLAISIDGQGVVADLAGLTVAFVKDGQTVATFTPDGLTDEKALMLVSIYKKGVWRMSAVGQGFHGGLARLIEYFGGEVADEPAPTNPPVPTSPPKSTVNLSKVTLTKSNSSVNLNKKDDFGKIGINLNWNRHASRSLFKSDAIDLDLGAFVALKDGSKYCIQAVGGNFGSLNHEPYLRLRNDDRTGTNQDGEWIDINGARWAWFDEVLIYAFIYSGVPNWQKTDGVVSISVHGEAPIETHLTEGSDRLGMCAIARLVNNGGALKVERINRYFSSHQEMDRAFGWGFSWVRGSK